MSDCSFELEALSKSDIKSQTALNNLNYTNQDYGSLLTRIVQFTQEKFPEDFNDYIESDLGIMLLEIWAFIADTLSFKMDQIVNEVFIDTVTEIDNAFRLSKLVGFQPTPPISSRAMFSATLQSSLQTDLIIPVGLQIDIVSSGESITYELFPADSSNNPIFEEDIVIQAGNLSNTTIVGLEGQTITDTFDSNGSINQTYTLAINPVIYDSVRVDVDGQRWEKVDYFTDSKSRNEYRVEFNSDWQAFVIFGNGRSGRTPSVGSIITVTYRTGGGTRGNIISGFIEIQRGFTVPGFGFSVPVTLRNYTKGEFGYNGDTIDDIRRKLPSYIKTQDRAVTGEDYQTLAEQYVSAYNGQIGKAIAALRNHGCAGNIVDVYILAKEGTNGLAEASDDLKAELLEYLEEKKMLTDYLCLKDGVIILVDVTLDVTIDKIFRKFKEEIETKITTKLNEFFSLTNWEFGKSLKESELMRYLSDIKEVQDITITFTTDDPDNSGTLVSTKYYEIIRNDTVTVNLTFQ